MDTNQTTNQPGVQQSGVQNTPVSSGGGTQVPQSPQPAQSVTSGGKESAPVATQQGEVRDYIAPSAPESVPDLSSEVKSAGVEVTPQPQQVRLSPQQQDAGVQLSGDATPLPAQQAGGAAQWTIDEIEKKASGPADDSGTWLNKLKLFVLGQRRQR